MLNIFRGIHSGPLPALTVEETELSARLRGHVEMLATTIGERNVMTHPQGLERAADYFETVMGGLRLRPARQPYSVLGGRPVRNVEGEITGLGARDEIIVVGAHYDSIASVGGCVGANDNASGVGAVLELARMLRTRALRRTVRFVGFVNEEPPFFQTVEMGSLVYACRSRERGENIVAMITPETIGCYSDAPGSQSYPTPLRLIYPGVGNFIAFVGNGSSKALVQRVTESFRRTTQFPAIGFAAPSWVTQAGWSDHWSFWKCGYPGLMVTDTAPLRYRHYHTPQDTPEKLDYDRMARVVAGLSRAIAELAG